MDRRTFIRGGLALPLGLFVPLSVFEREFGCAASYGGRGVACAAGLKKYKVDGESESEATLTHHLGVFRGGAPETIVDVPHDIHSIVTSRADPQTLILVSKEQKSGSIFHRPSKRLVTFNAKGGNVLSGHGTFTPRSDFFITSETNESQSSGELVVRTSQTGAVVGALNSGGIYPHEMTFLKSGKELLVANGGLDRAGANVSILSFPKGDIVKIFPTPDVEAGPRHIAPTSGTEVIIGSWNRLSAEDERRRGRPRPEEAKPMILDLGSGGELSAIQISAQNRVEFSGSPHQYLSVGFHSITKLGVLTASGANVVLVVEPDKGIVRKVIPNLSAAGVCDVGDGIHMAISLSDGRLAYLDMVSLELSIVCTLEQHTRFNSHLTAIFS